MSDLTPEDCPGTVSTVSLIFLQEALDIRIPGLCMLLITRIYHSVSVAAGVVEFT